MRLDQYQTEERIQTYEDIGVPQAQCSGFLSFSWTLTATAVT